jgi:hypothetical protein
MDKKTLLKKIGIIALGCGIITACLHFAFINVCLFMYQTVTIYETNTFVNWVELVLFVSVAIGSIAWVAVYIAKGDIKRGANHVKQS